MAMIGLSQRQAQTFSPGARGGPFSLVLLVRVLEAAEFYYHILPLVLLKFLWDLSACPGLRSLFTVISQAPDWPRRRARLL